MKKINLKEKFSMFISRIWVKILYFTKVAHSSNALPHKHHFKEDVIKEDVQKSNLKSLVVFLLGVSLALVMYIKFIQPPVNFPIGKLVAVEKGLSLREIASSLKEQNVIKSSVAFEVVVRLLGNSEKLHAGDYIFKKPKSLFGIVNVVSNGLFGLEPVKITIPEGISIAEMAKIYEKKLMRFDAKKFEEIAKNSEGYLFPDTYHFLPNVTEEKVYKTMRDNFNKKIEQLQDDIESFGKPLDEIVNMASIVQREAWKYKDQRLIAGVLWKRLEIGMPLQVDATFVYTHNKGSSQITLDELKDKNNPYNTYSNKGLPPTPIGNPGFWALKATLNPIESPYLFYLADKYGNTYYSRTYREHMQKRAQYIDF